MTSPALIALGTVIVAVLLGILLLITKAVNSWRARFEAIRRASYIAVFGELTSRGSYPLDILSCWADDPVFRTALVDFIRLLDGVERNRLLRVARDLGIVDSAVVALRKARRSKSRVRAASMLSELADPKTVRPLMAALADPEAGVRLNAVAALAKIGEPTAIQAILDLIDNETEWDAARAMDHLATLGAAAVDGLLAYLGDLTEAVPRYARLALQTLGEIGDLRAEPALIAALESPVRELRLVAAGGLQTCGSLNCVAPLIAAMADEDGRVRARAAKSLGAHFDTRAIEPLFAGLHDEEWWVRKNSAEALAQLPEGIAALQRALRSRDLFARDAAREQLMILGVPAGSTAELEPEDVSHAHDWIEDQLRELEKATKQTAEPGAAGKDGVGAGPDEQKAGTDAGSEARSRVEPGPGQQPGGEGGAEPVAEPGGGGRSTDADQDQPSPVSVAEAAGVVEDRGLPAVPESGRDNPSPESLTALDNALDSHGLGVAGDSDRPSSTRRAS